jgi:PAS domain S-box-containing protein
MRFSAWHHLSDAYRNATEGFSPWAADDPAPQPLVVPDVDAEPRLAAHHATIRAEGIRSLAFVPLVAANELLGRFMLYGSEPGTFGEAEVMLAELIAGYMAPAIDRARVEARRIALLEKLPTGVLVAEVPSGRITIRNEAADRLLGASPAGSLTAASSFQALHPDGRPYMPEEWPLARASALGEVVVDEELVLRRADGERRTLLVSAAPVHDPTGRVMAAAATFHDVTELREAEAQQRAQARVLAQLVERTARLQALTARLSQSLSAAEWAEAAVREAMAALGAARGLVQLVSTDGAALETIAVADYGEEIERWARIPLDASLPGPDAVRARDLVCIGNRAELAARYPTVAHATRPDTQAWACIPLVADERAIGGMTLTFAEPQDFTTDDRAFMLAVARQCAQALVRAQLYEDSQRAIRARDEFLSIASHELRNPVAGIAATAQLLRRLQQRGPVDPTRLDRYVGLIEHGSKRLASLTDDLLDVARLQRGELPLRLQPVDLTALVRLTASLQDDDPLHDVLVDLTLEPCWVVADPDRLGQIVTNLLDNARKYSPAGGPIHIRLAADAGGVTLEVRDGGVGLPPDETERIFEPFGRASNAARQNIPGLGLGLYICRRIAEQHGGQLTAASAGEGQGTTVTLWLPREQGATDDGRG